MKRIIKILIFTIIICITQYCQVFAANNVSINLISNSTNDSVKAGEKITIIITGAVNEEGINGLQGKISYDSNVLEYVSKKSEKEGWSVTGYNESTGIFLAEVINVLDDNTFAKDEENAILSFTFKVKKDTTASDTQITISDIVASPTTVEVSKNSISKKITIVKDENDDQDNNKDNENEPSDDSNNNSNSDNNNNSSNNENSNNNANKQDGTTSQNKLPDTGLNTEIILIFTSIIILISSYLGYKKYKDIK